MQGNVFQLLGIRMMTSLESIILPTVNQKSQVKLKWKQSQFYLGAYNFPINMGHNTHIVHRSNAGNISV
jgi:hypothetical protein